MKKTCIALKSMDDWNTYIHGWGGALLQRGSLFICVCLTRSCLTAYYVLRAVGVSNWRTGVSWPFCEGAMCSDSRRQISKYAQQWDLADPWQMGLSGLGKTLASQ